MRKILASLITLTLLAGVCWAGWTYRFQIVSFVEEQTAPVTEKKPKPDPELYTVLTDDMEEHRQRLAGEFRTASNQDERAAVLEQARELLEKGMPRMMRCWLGTPWDFNGIAHEPGGGKVACGYFVSSVLQDAGFKVEWAPLAQQASQNILETFLPREEMSIRVGMEYDEFLAEVITPGAGIYIVGLDSHVAFLVVPPDENVRFIHSSGSAPYCVVDESRDDANVLKSSRYRVTGNLTANKDVLRSWLLGSKFKTHTL